MPGGVKVNGGTTPDALAAKAYRFDPKWEPLAILQATAPDAFVLLPAPVRAAAAEYIRQRANAEAMGLPTGPTRPGEDFMNQAMRAARAPRVGGDGAPGDDHQAAEPSREPEPQAGQGDMPTTSPYPVPDNRLIVAREVAQAMGFIHPDTAVRLVGEDLNDDGSNTGQLLADVAVKYPGALKVQFPTGDIGQGRQGSPAPSGDAVNQWLRGAVQHRRERTADGS